MSEKLAYTVPELIQASGLGRTSIYKAIGMGKLPIRKYGSRTLVLKDDAETFLKSLDEPAQRVAA